ncbi:MULTISPECIES: hypothetical protein [Enterococcus]|uniref:Uncharacterized protein n=1 Tax=Candidatus Enterococcus ferrettii TaxID=2815324 RepID=A0ABV0EVG4_9ENTE|nr:hypothetical protein [Enterococcus sp. 665A]MBO1343001.1 hypothetical protein [Enterococcus sp. 665A]
MKFTYIVIYSIRDFNKNKERDGHFPHDGVVINAMINANTALNCVAVGFEK